MEKFKEWLDKSLDDRNWKYADLARFTGLDSAVISNIVNGRRGLGIDTAALIGDVLAVRPDFLLRLYGALPPIPKEENEIEQLAYRISKLPAEDQQIIDDLIQAMLSRRGIFTNEKNNISNTEAPSA
ncbi:helix-turn-helix transcriptional regulator [Ornatilinea apprima]|uniref:helix-turn-helix transcriptional regulator n=1 Tax=Ornatilinea apprima TaxID=1134406 RepID=UPI0009465D33|nr:helix-turn-helix domain-containing protein [Ornatilinea apprima]